MSRAERLAEAVTDRRRRLHVLAVTLAALLALAALSSLLGDTVTTDRAAALPRGSESRTVAELARRYPSGQTTSAVVVARRAGGVRPSDLMALRELRVADLRTASVRRSKDGTTALAVYTLRLRPRDSSQVSDAVTALRGALRPLREGGLKSAVTGPAGFHADVEGAFAGADVTLLAGSAALVLVLLIVIYRSPVFWTIPLFGVALTEAASRGAGAALAKLGVPADDAAAGIASVLTFGAATDYALLLVSRYRDELREHEHAAAAMRRAVAASAPTIVASAATVVCGLLCLLLARVGSTQAIGPLTAVGVALAAATTLVLLPVLLLLAGRRVFWPFIPRPGAGPATHGVWRRTADLVARRPAALCGGGAVVLAVLALGVTQLQLSSARTNALTGRPESVRGQELLTRAFPAGTAAGSDVIVRDRAAVARVRRALHTRRGLVAAVSPPQNGPPGPRLAVTLRADPFSDAGIAATGTLRRVVHRASPSALVGGQAAEDRDLRAASERDTRLIVPTVLALITLILVALLRALVLPLVLLVTVVASFAAALGLGAAVFAGPLGLPTQEPSLPLIAFVFLAALGIDYNVFLSARAKEEAAEHGTREGMRRALISTGGVITSAGVVLAGTFAILAALPVVTLRQLGVIIATGVVLDTLLVRSLIVPAAVEILGDRAWWPRRTARHAPGRIAEAREEVPLGRYTHHA